MFYNLLPGAVGGDVYRGYATRALFAESKATRALGVALMERVLGLAGLFALAALAVPLSPFVTSELLLYAALTLGAVALGMAALVWGPRLSARLPALARRPLALLTVVHRPGPLSVALALSIVTHITASMNGYAVVRDLVPNASFGGSMVIFPIGTLASYFPLTIAGAGARDAVLVLLLARIGVGQAHALVTSLAMLACNLIVSTFGGLLQLAGFSASAVERAGLPSTARRSSRDD
jgi:uncharacterized membrane protein YbhN (UPF0104 family)